MNTTDPCAAMSPALTPTCTNTRHRSTTRLLSWLTLLALLSVTVLPGCTTTRWKSWLNTNDIEMRLADPVRDEARLSVLWIGHATMLIQMDDKFILADPLFAETIGQISKRVLEEGFNERFLPPLDAVLISHMHMDHLSLGSLDRIEELVDHLLVPPQGLVYIPSSLDFPASEVATWQSWDDGDGLKITAVPVEHSGWRYFFDADWMTQASTAWVIEYNGMTVYFGGDTAYAPEHFAATRERFPDIDLALLPIGPITPVSVMRPHHIDPSQAVQIFTDLEAGHMIPMHYGNDADTFDKPEDAVLVLRELMYQGRIRAEEITVLEHGEQVIYAPTTDHKLVTVDHITRAEIDAAGRGERIMTVDGPLRVSDED